MDIVYGNFDQVYAACRADAYALAFLLTRSKKAADDVFLKSLLSFSACAHDSDDAAKEALFRAVMDECEDYYLRKLRRAPKRETLQSAVSFRVSDALWALLKEPYALKAAAFLTERMGFDDQKTAALLHMSAARVGKLREMKPSLSPLSVVQMTGDEARAMSDAVYMRFAERNVPFENKLRRFRRAVDNLVPWLALLVVLLFVLAALYTANIQAPPIG